MEEPQEQESLLFDLACMTGWHYFKQILPLPIRLFLRVWSLGPRILKGLEQVANGNVFKSEVLDAAAISMSLITGDVKTASNINFLLNIGDTIEEFTKKKSYSDLADRLLSQNDQVQLVEHIGGKITEKTVPLSVIKKGDVVAVRTGNVIPVDGTVVRGEGLAVNENGGYSLFEFFTQNPTLNKKSLVRLRDKITGSDVKVVCTGHSGIRTDMSKLFAHIDESAVSKRGKPFDPTAPKSIRK
ncbi:MAG: hypothetical protein J6Y60_01210 [Treponema sp.]|nr:hypothetical protein [Treponema sp.]